MVRDMSPPSSASEPRRGQGLSRSELTAARLLDAAQEAAADDGEGGLTFLRVAERAGTSRRPLHDRFTDRSALMAAVWCERSLPAVQQILIDALSAAGALDSEADHGRCAQILDDAAHPDVPLRAAAELVLAAQFDPALGEVVRGTLGTQLAALVTARGRQVTRVLAAKRAYLLCLVLGLIVAGRRTEIGDISVAYSAGPIVAAVVTHRDEVPLPAQSLPHLDAPVPFATGDATRDLLLQCMLDQVGQWGYLGTSVERVARGAGSSQGAIFGRYDSKLDLFLDATSRQNAIAFRETEAFMVDIARQYGTGIAEAVTIRESQRVGREGLRAVALEGVRLSWHDERMKQATEAVLTAFEVEAHASGSPFMADNFHFGYAIGLGILVLPILTPNAWKLPYDVMTVPLADTLG